jgi:fucose permease
MAAKSLEWQVGCMLHHHPDVFFVCLYLPMYVRPSPYARIALMALFFNSGMIYASWGIQVPFVKARFGLSAALLSLALLAVAIGSIGAMTRVGRWLSRISGRQAVGWSGIATSIATALILLMPSFASLCVALLLFGATMAAIDVAINAEASALETAARRPIMSSLHGMFSVGGMAGAAFGGLLMSHGVAPETHMTIAAALSVLTVLIARNALSSQVARPPAANDPVFHIDSDEETATAGGGKGNTSRSNQEKITGPSKALTGNVHLWALGGVAMIALVAEGAMYDWSTVYMRDVLGSSPGLASAAYATFSTGMAAGRFAGDAVRARTGNGRLLLVSGLVAAAGMAGALLLESPLAALTGFALMGLGLANMIPVLFAAAGQVPGFPPAQGIARVAGAAYTGMMIGPVVIGLIAQASSLPIGLSVVAVASAAVGFAGARVLKQGRRIGARA